MKSKKPKEKILNKVQRAAMAGIPKDIQDAIKQAGPEIKEILKLGKNGDVLATVLNDGMRLYKWNYFITKFRIVQFGETLLNDFIKIGAIDTETLTWYTKELDFLKTNFKNYSIISLYGILIYFWDENYFIDGVTKPELMDIAHQVFNVQPAKETLKKARGNPTARKMLKEMGFKK